MKSPFTDFLPAEETNTRNNAQKVSGDLKIKNPFVNDTTYENLDSEIQRFEESEDAHLSSFEYQSENEIEQDDKYSYNREAEIAGVIEHQATVAKATAPKSCEGYTCWAKTVLNRELGFNLSSDNLLDAQTKKAIGSFQSKNNLPLTQKIDSVTERALLELEALQRHKGTVKESAAINIISTAKTKIEDWTKKAIVEKPEITNGYRDPRKVHAFVLHHMAFKRKSTKTKQFSDPDSYLKTGAHFCIMFDGRIIQLHPVSRMIWHSNCTSPRSVGVEFEGNFPNVKGQWWINKKSTVQNKDYPTQAQFDSGKFLASYLKIVMGTTHILAHRQSSDSRENDPGPDIWYNVGQWAINNLSLTDGGSDFKCGTGKPILSEWRTWAEKIKPTVNPEYNATIHDEAWDENESRFRECENCNEHYKTETDWENENKLNHNEIVQEVELDEIDNELQAEEDYNGMDLYIAENELRGNINPLQKNWFDNFSPDGDPIIFYEDVRIKAGETIVSLAAEYGFDPDEWREIWNDPKNSGLKAKRKLSTNLKVDDVLFIPIKWRITNKTLDPAGATFTMMAERSGKEGARLDWVQTVYGHNQPNFPVKPFPAFSVDLPTEDDKPFYWTQEEYDNNQTRNKISDSPFRNAPTPAQGATTWRAVTSLCLVTNKRVSIWDTFVWGINFNVNGINTPYVIRQATDDEINGHLNLLRKKTGKSKRTYTAMGWTFRSKNQTIV